MAVEDDNQPAAEALAGLSPFDVIMRHQAYVEGVKFGQQREFNSVIDELFAELRRRLAFVKYDTLDQLTKRELQKLIRELKRAQWKILSEYSTRLVAWLQEYMTATRELHAVLFGTILRQEPSRILAQASTDANAWSKIANAPIPANGMLLDAFMTAVLSSAVVSMTNLIPRGYAERWTMKELMVQIGGEDPRTYRGSLLGRINAQAAAMQNTVIQHVMSQAQAEIAAILFDEYYWASILDDGTTPICRNRNGKRYRYGYGPVPPAHVGCRSSAVPLRPGAADPEPPRSFGMWAKQQPRAFQNDFLGQERADALANGTLKASDLRFERPGALSIAQLRAKRGLILALND